MIESADLVEAVTSFCRLLRTKEFTVGHEEIANSIQGLNQIDLTDLEQFYYTLQMILCTRKEELDVFEHLFFEFFSIRKDLFSSHFDQSQLLARKREPGKDKGRLKRLNENITPKKNQGKNIRQSSYSFIDHLKEEMGKTGKVSWLATRLIEQEKQRMLPAIPLEHELGLKIAARVFAKHLPERKTRRYEKGKEGNRIHFSATIRKSLATGNVPIEAVHFVKKKEKASVVFLCDGSRSMAHYSELFLQFAISLMDRVNNMEIFLFSTKLRKITESLKRNGKKSVSHLFLNGEEWKGGTCIGESLNTFAKKYGDKLLSKKTTIIIASDGFDGGDVSTIESTMKVLKQNSATIIWLNPLKNIPNFQPEARAMRKALPYIDVFSGAVTAKQLKQLGESLRRRKNEGNRYVNGRSGEMA